MKLKAATLIILLLLASFAGAFIEDKPKGKQWIPEETDASIATKQKYQGTRDVVGAVPDDTTPQKSGAPMSDPEARAALNAPVAEDQVLAEGTKRLSEKPKSSSLLWGVILGCAGFGSVLAFRQWANKNIPDGPR
ncbi:MAG: hypothetical protein K1X67_12505 [Fimbriimonadaceae bacterium]|nr:hypothetical protein [Fimbriimonadaceae bacterium]